MATRFLTKNFNFEIQQKIRTSSYDITSNKKFIMFENIVFCVCSQKKTLFLQFDLEVSIDGLELDDPAEMMNLEIQVPVVTLKQLSAA